MLSASVVNPQPTHGRPRPRVPLVVALAFCGGCYTYAPIEPQSVRRGTMVRARVSAAASDRLTPFVGSSGRVLSGTMIAATADSLVVDVPSATDVPSGGALQTLYQRVSIARSEVLELETRTLDRFRTGVLATATALVAGSLMARALRGEPAIDRSAGGGGPADLRAP